MGSRPGNRPNGGGNQHGGSDDGTCTRDDYNNKNKHSWRTNCPSGCGITEYVNELDGQIDDNRNKLVVSMDKVKSDGAKPMIKFTLLWTNFSKNCEKSWPISK